MLLRGTVPKRWDRKFAFNTIFGEGKENLNVQYLRKLHTHMTCTMGAFLYDDGGHPYVRWTSAYAPYAHIRSSTTVAIYGRHADEDSPRNGLGGEF